jgi:hypothetical protein
MKATPGARYLGLAAFTCLLGTAVAGADMYFGKSRSLIGAFILGVLLLGGLVFEFLAAVQPLRSPRALDADFLAGADYAERKRIALRQLRSTLLRQVWMPLGALCVAGAQLGLSLSRLAGVAAVLAGEAALVSLAMMGAVRFGWVRLSRKRFQAAGPGGTGASDAFGAAAATFLIRRSAAAARILTGWIPDPERWILRRKLLYLLRADPVYLIIHTLLIAVLALGFNTAWSFNLSAVFTVAAIQLSLTLLQIAFREPDAYYAQCGHFLPPRSVDRRATLFLFLAIAGLLCAPFAAGCLAHMGIGGALTSRAFWHVLATGAALPLLISLDPPRAAAALGGASDINARVVLNFCYLGLAAWLFMFSWSGVAFTAAVGALSAFLLRRELPARKAAA